MKNDDKIMMTNTNAQLFELADIITDNGYDIYSYVASKIFNKPYEECHEFNSDMSWNPTGKLVRNIAKAICMNAMSIDELSEKYRLPYLPNLVADAFPFTFIEDIDDNDVSDDVNDRCCAAITFLVALTGHVRFIRYYEGNCKALRKLMHIGEA